VILNNYLLISIITISIALMISATPQTAFATSHILYLHDVVSNLPCSSGGLSNAMDSTIGTNARTQLLDGTEDWWIEPANPRTIPAGNWQVVFDTTTAGGGGPAGKVTVKVLKITDNCTIQTIIPGQEIDMVKGTTQEYSITHNPGQVTVNSGERILVSFAQTSGNRDILLRYDGASGAFNDSYLETPGGPPPPPPPPTEILYLRLADNNYACAGNGENKDLLSTAGPSIQELRLDGTEDWWVEPANPRTIPAGDWQVVFDAQTAGGGGPAGKVTVKVLRVTDDTTCAVQQTIIPAQEIAMEKDSIKEYSTAPFDPGFVTVAQGEKIIVSFEQTGGNRAINLRYDSSATFEDSYLEYPATVGPPPPGTLSFDQKPYVFRHDGYVRYFDPNMEGDGVTWFMVNVNSTMYPAGISVNVTEIIDDGQFTSKHIQFTSDSDNNPNSLKLYVEVGGHVNVTGSNALPDSAGIVSDTSGDILYANKRADGNWATCPDDDDDGICNDFETSTGLVIDYPSSGGGQDYTYPCDQSGCPNPNYKDLYLEIDYMYSHQPDSRAITDLINAFRSAPVSNPNGTSGINLHVQWGPNISDVFGHEDTTRWPGANSLPGFDQMKAVYFGTPDERESPDFNSTGWKQKKQAFRYAEFLHKQAGDPLSSGKGELLGNDFIVSLGNFTNENGTPDQQAGTMMHELGHNLYLNHGGAWNDYANCKPNLVSVMNYAMQFSDYVPNRQLNYSSVNLNTTEIGSVGGLVENLLNETAGVGSYTTDPEQEFVFGVPTTHTPPVPLPFTGDGVDWNNNGTVTPSPLYSLDINYLEDSLGNVVCGPSPGQILVGHNDWAKIDFDARGTGNWFDGRMSSPCKSGDPNRGGQCVGGQGKARNEKSHWYPQFKNRLFGDVGISADQTVALRVLRMDALENFIVNLDSSHFYDPGNHTTIKDAYVAKLSTIKDHFASSHSDVDRLIQAMEELDVVRRTFDGKELTSGGKIVWSPHMTTLALGPIISGVPNEHTDLIINDTSQEILRFVLDGSTHSVVKASNFLPTPLHPGPSPCSSITPSTGGITYDLTYCIKNGEVLDAVFDNAANKSLTVTIQANGDGFFKLDAADVIGPTNAISEGYSVSIDGDEKIFDDAKIYDSRYVTVAFAAGDEKIKIGEPPGPPTFPWWIWLLIVIIIIIIAIVAWYRRQNP